ncbi:MAG: HDIG domain-containing protein [Candidatus Promineofilum sp.]|nr:HDIG domain-containing protein [Promineifilum sp.]
MREYVDLILPPLLEQLRPLLSARSQPVYLVGGTVRDAVLGRLTHDIDLAVAEGAISLTFELADALARPAFVLDRERDVGRILLPDQHLSIDIACFRGPTLESDLLGRDFTINAMALPAGGRTLDDIVDPHRGLADMEQHLIRSVHSQSIADDPIRALRACRFVAQFGFSLSHETAARMTAAVPLLPDSASPERIRDELSRLLMTGAPAVGFDLLHELGLLARVLPNLAALDGIAQSPPHHEDVLRHTWHVLFYLEAIGRLVGGDKATDEWGHAVEALILPYREALSDHLTSTVDGGMSGRLLLMWAGLFHDIGKRQTRTTDDDGRIRFFGHDEVGADIAARIVSSLSFSNEAKRRARTTVAGHMRPLQLALETRLPSRRATYRYFRALHEAGLDVGLLALADHLATYDGIGDRSAWESLLRIVGSLYQTYFTGYEQTVAPPRLLSGQDIMAELDEPPGKEIGRLLHLLEEAQASGEISSRDEALTFVRRHRAE